MALAKKQSDLPAPTKRQSFVTKRRAESDENRPGSSYMAPTRFTGLLIRLDNRMVLNCYPYLLTDRLTVSYFDVTLVNQRIHLRFLLPRVDTPTDTPLGSEEDLAPTPPLSNRARSSLQPDESSKMQSDLTRRRSNELGNRGPPPDVTIPQGDSSNFGMNTRRSVHMSSVRAKRNQGSVLFVYEIARVKIAEFFA